MKFQTTSAFPQVCILLFLLFFQIGDEEERAAAEMIDKTDHEDGKKEIFLFILDFVSVFFWELFQYLNA